VVVDDVERRHGEAGAVHHASDRAIELDVAEAVARGAELGRILLGRVAIRLEIAVAIESVVIEGELRVERDDLVGRREDERIDLREARVRVEKRRDEAAEHVRATLHGCAGESESAREDAPFVRLEPGDRIDRTTKDLLGRARGDLLDVDATFGGDHEDRHLRLAIENDTGVVLARDLGRLRHENDPDRLPGGPRLRRDEPVAEDALRLALDLVDRAAQLHAAAFAAAAGVDLRLDDPSRAAELLRDRGRLLGGRGDAAARHRHTSAREDLLRLVFVDLHRSSFRKAAFEMDLKSPNGAPRLPVPCAANKGKPRPFAGGAPGWHSSSALSQGEAT